MALGASGTVVIAIRRIYQTKRPDGNAERAGHSGYV
jgi:hypothetical protein